MNSCLGNQSLWAQQDHADETRLVDCIEELR